MKYVRELRWSRRSLLAMTAAGVASLALPQRPTVTAERVKEVALKLMPTRIGLLAPPAGATEAWSYQGQVPGPEIRLRQGDGLRVVVENGLPDETTVHWHGLRIANAMDGVPHLTQKPIPPGGRFTYEFVPPDAGTYWYHPHHRSNVQVGRGLFAPLIIDEREPIRVDRDVTWVLNDWRLKADGEIADDFGSFDDRFNEGHIGGTVTVNGRLPAPFEVRAGERIRLRLINAAVARIFGLRFTGHAPIAIAYDGQPVAPHEPEDQIVLLGPSQRVDLIMDMTGRPGERFAVTDKFHELLPKYTLLDIVYGAEPPLRERPPADAIALPPNALAEPDVAQAERLDIIFGGGNLGNGAMWGDMAGGVDWSINSQSLFEHVHEPLLTLKRGRSYVFDMQNKTGFFHPIHLHGHSFRVLARDHKPTPHREWRDTVLMAPVERVEIAFVADNPGDWMFHCHILDHQAFGMMASVRVE